MDDRHPACDDRHPACDDRHPAYDNGALRITETASPAGLAITGDIDEATYPALVTSLHDIAERHHELHLDLSGVSYCDLAGLRAIVRLADGGRGGLVRQVLLHNVPHHLQVALTVTGWDALPGLAVEPRPSPPGPPRVSPASPGPATNGDAGRCARPHPADGSPDG